MGDSRRASRLRPHRERHLRPPSSTRGPAAPTSPRRRRVPAVRRSGTPHLRPPSSAPVRVEPAPPVRRPRGSALAGPRSSPSPTTRIWSASSSSTTAFPRPPTGSTGSRERQRGSQRQDRSISSIPVQTPKTASALEKNHRLLIQDCVGQGSDQLAAVATLPAGECDSMEIMTGALSALLLKLAKLLTDRYKLQRRLRGEIMFLKAELESMQAALEKVSDAPVTDNQVRIWAQDVRELSYDIEDGIDRFMVRVDADPSASAELHGTRGFIQRSLKLLTTANIRHSIAKDIRGIKVLVSEVASRRDRYNIDSSVSSIRSAMATVVDPRLIGLYEEATKLVGISGPQQELIKMLMEPQAATTLEDVLKVISIVGVGGLGKTTLANAVYQHLRGQFDCHAFVSVSLRPDLNNILSSILRQVR